MWPNSRDEPIRRLPVEESRSDLVERLERRRLKRQVVEATTTENRNLPFVFVVTCDFEHVQFCRVTQPDRRHLEPVRRLKRGGRCVEHPLVERRADPYRRSARDVIDAAQEHDEILARRRGPE